LDYQADENDLTAARVVFEGMNNCKIYADKILYADRDLNSGMQANQNSTILTLVKKHKGQKIVDAAGDTYSYLISKVRSQLSLSLTG